ncbi:hypothetical protein [Lacticaseibacillus salsurivasis]|uniref:hypothetical protein n=1 Tax=Lacticaseibacillus salsurivasis TaxID=3081441 RepID=UPI0030C709F8
MEYTNEFDYLTALIRSHKFSEMTLNDIHEESKIYNLNPNKVSFILDDLLQVKLITFGPMMDKEDGVKLMLLGTASEIINSLECMSNGDK